MHVFSQTLQISIIGTILCLLIGFPFAYWLATRVTARWRGVLLGLVIVPFFVNFLIRTIGWLILLAPSGPVSTLLQKWGLRSEPLHLLQTRGAVQLGVVYNYLALMIFPLFVTLDRLDPAMREASKDLGASRWKTFRQVTLPLAAPGIVAGLLLVFIPLSGDYITACAGRSEGEHGGRDGRDRIQHGAELGSRLGAGRHPDHHDHGHGGRVRLLGLVIRTIARARRKITLPSGCGVRCMSAAEVVTVEAPTRPRKRGVACLGCRGVRVPVPPDPRDRHLLVQQRTIDPHLQRCGTGWVSDRDH